VSALEDLLRAAEERLSDKLDCLISSAPSPKGKKK
jgi:hypothetical protein